MNDPLIVGYFAASTDRLAASYAALHQWDNAAREYDEPLRVVEPVAKCDPEEYELAYLLVKTYAAEGAMAAGRASARGERLGHWQVAAEWFRKSLNTWSKIPHPARISPSGFEVTMPSEVSRRLARAEREVKWLGGTPGHQ